MSPSLMLKRYRVWLLLFLLAAALPWLFFNWSTGRHSGFVLTMLSEIGLITIFALSFNMQMGQAGLLSFGHAVLFGMGGYCTAHALNAIKAGSFWLPTELMPLVGGLGGLGFGVVFGYVATQQRATAFAMITMGIGELVAAAALMFMTFFGGEGGVTTNRMIDTSLVGASYSAPWQVYYLILVWALVCVILMRLQTQTPLGRMANATRDNFERAQFVGYDPRMVRFYQFIVSGFFAGIAGGLYAMLYEIVTFDTVSAVKSSTALLATYIGGVGVFFGPTAGYLIGWIFGAAAVGFLMQKLPIASIFIRALVASLIGGVFVIYLFGIPYLAFVARLTLDKAFLAGAVFLPGDILKAVLAALVAKSYFASRTPIK